MSSLTNPFDILPPNLFNIFSTQGQGEWQRHCMAVLLRIYQMAEFNRFGLTREQVVAEMADYLTRDMGKVITPAKVQQFVNQFFNGSATLHVRDFPPHTFAAPADLPWLIYTIAYSHHPEVDYNLNPLSGEPVDLDPVQVKPFQLVKRST